jgi:hypothetical protein
MTQCLQNGFLGFNLESRTALIYGSGETKISYTSISAAGEAILGALQNPSATTNKYLYIASTTASQNYILASLEKATSKTWTVNKANTAEARKEGAEKLAQGDFSGIVPLLQGLMYGGDTEGDFEKTPGGLANKILGVPQENLDDLVRGTVQGKRP